MLQILLPGLYFISQATADICAVKIMRFGPLFIPAGSLIYSITFSLRDLIHKRLGKECARWCVIVAGLNNLIMVAYIIWAAKQPPAPFWPYQTEFLKVFGLIPRIVIASIVAEVFAELLDTELYSFYYHHISRRRDWGRVAFSNLFACPLDSLVFLLLAFFGEFGGMWSLLWSLTVYKWGVSALSLATIYLVKQGGEQ